jgi:hypothetical protein
LTPSTRLCRACAEYKPLNQFLKRSGKSNSRRLGKPYGRCVDCRRKKYISSYSDPDYFWDRKINAIRRHKRGRKLRVEIDQHFLKKLWRRQNGQCALSGKPMRIMPGRGYKTKDAPSVDRIDPNGHYTEDNVWLVTNEINFAKHQLSVEDFIALCKAVAYRDEKNLIPRYGYAKDEE